LATFVAVRSRERVHVSFTILTYVISAWVVANYVGSNFKSHYFARYFTHADFMLGAAACFLFLYFTGSMLVRAEPPRRFVKWDSRLRMAAGVTTILVMIMTLSPFVASVASRATSNTYQIKYGGGYAAYTVVLAVILLLGVFNLALTLKYAKGAFHKQIITISEGLIVAVAFIAVANLILPQLSSSTSLNLAAGNMSYLGIVVFVVATSYAIVHHRLFDLRFFVVRAVAYGFSTAALALICLLPGAWIISHILHVNLTVLGFISIAALSFCLTFAYQHLKKVFDRITLQIFYRHYYDPQDVLDRLSDLLVRSIDIAWLQAKSGEIIKKALGVRLLEYWLSEGSHGHAFRDVEALFSSAKSQGVIVLDEVAGHGDVVSRLRQRNVAAVVRLRTTHGELGYMVLGFKESGEIYTHEDKRLLSTAADEIAISMQNALHFEEIQNFNKTLQARINKATTELSRTNDKLKQLDETKDEFISMASHQLRTPLTSVKGYLSMVLEGDVGPINDQQRQMLTQSYNSSQRMVYLISDLLNLSRLNTGKFVIETASVDLRDVVQAEVDQLTETAKSREVDMVYQNPAAFPRLMLDETKIHQVVMNLLDNAIYYTPAGGKIIVTLAETPQAIEFTVKDNGIGVPRRTQHKLFTKFYRAQNAQQARPDGTGLGLFMAKKVIVAQGGAIIFDSTEGKGSTFGFRFSKRGHLAEN
jgi:signal transduction histidine kinase